MCAPLICFNEKVKKMPTTEFFDWIEKHKNDNPATLRLKFGADMADEILQVECRKKFASKLSSTLSADPQFVFPSMLAGEQATGDALAAWHAAMFDPGEKVVDLTAGLGIDAMAAARRVGREGTVVAVELDGSRAEALRWNTRMFDNLEVVGGDCREIVKAWAADGMRFNCAFVDPARRSADGGRVYSLADCEPNVVEMLPDLKKICKRLVVKASPMLDITHTAGILPEATEIVSLGTTTECKELDIVCDFTSEAKAEPRIRAITIGRDFLSEFTFLRSEETEAQCRYGVPEPGGYVLDPYPAVMKAAPLKLLGARYGVAKAAPNSHLWFSPTRVEGFPGRQYRITEILPYMSKHIKRYASAHPAVGVTVRNFDMTADALRAKLRVKDGSDRLFAVSLADGRKLMITAMP